LTRFLLIRHAPHADVGIRLTGRDPSATLTEDGRAMAARLGAHLATERLDAIHSSPQPRTRQTAGAVAAPHGLAVTMADALDEIDFGAWRGERFDALDADPAWQHWNTSRAAARPPGGETMAEACDRAAAHLEATARDLPHATVAIVTHADIIRALAARALGLSLDRLLAFDVDPASVTRLHAGPGGWRLNSLNESLAA
jgi:broad specificity phosphatase PhoE